MNDPSMTKAVAMLLAAHPDHAVAVWLDGQQYRCGLVGRPQPSAITGEASECRNDPQTAVLRMREKLIGWARDTAEKARIHLDKLTISPWSGEGRNIERPIPNCPHYFSGCLKRSCIDCNPRSDTSSKPEAP